MYIQCMEKFRALLYDKGMGSLTLLAMCLHFIIMEQPFSRTYSLVPFILNILV